jgi:hypothetical protein
MSHLGGFKKAPEIWAIVQTDEVGGAQALIVFKTLQVSPGRRTKP